MKWDESLSIGVAKIDGQHRKLIGMVQQLESSLRQGNPLSEMGRTLKSLVDYTSYHFKDEEDLMHHINFQGYQEHEQQHRKLIEDVRRILVSIRGGAAFTAQDLIQFLTNWVVDHIEKEDKKIGAELERHRTDPADASKVQAQVKKAPTQEMKVSLNALTSLLDKGFIESADYQLKKTELLEKYVKKFHPQSLVELTEEFNEFHSLLADGLTTEDDEKHFKPLMFARVDLAAILALEESLENRFTQLNGLLETGIITREIYESCKTQLLKNL